jgi:hypothetical protein
MRNRGNGVSDEGGAAQDRRELVLPRLWSLTPALPSDGGGQGRGGALGIVIGLPLSSILSPLVPHGERPLPELFYRALPPMNPPLHPSQEGNLQQASQTKLPSWEGLGVGQCKSWKCETPQVPQHSRSVHGGLRTFGLIAWLISVMVASTLACAQIPSSSSTARASDANAAVAASESIPTWFAKASPLPPPQGAVIRVATVNELLAAVDRVEPGGSILLADGHYKLPRVIVLEGKKRIAIRSSSGDPAKVILSGKGWESQAKGDDILHIARCEGVTIADLTFTDCRSYGIKVEAENAPKDIHIYNCRFRDIGVRAIKGSAGQDANIRAVKGSVRFCSFENTKVPPADWLYDGDYIAAIDMMALEDWIFSDNVFRNIKGRNGGGRAAIFIWVRSRQVVVERNLIINCDRGVAFGNPGRSTADAAGEQPAYVTDGMIRNNFIAGGADCGIELWHADRIKVYNNTIWRPERNWSRGIRVGTGTSHTDIVNNLVHGDVRLEGGKAELRQNLAGRIEGYFVDPVSGNLALTSAAARAIEQGVSLPEVTDDIRRRPRTGLPDLGAWEFDRAGQVDK